jgi:Diguanylate cyclase, GGDEF domain
MAETQLMDEDYLRFRARTIGLGIGISFAAVAALAPWVATTWDRPHRGLLVVLLSLAALTSTVVTFLPHEGIVRSRHRERFFLGWSLAYTLIITALCAADGGASSPVAALYFLTLVFAALSYPLRWTTATIAALLRPADAIGRLGGDEFAVLLPGATRAVADEVAERLRAALVDRIDATMGVASAPEDGADPDEVSRRADVRPYATRERDPRRTGVEPRATPSAWPPRAWPAVTEHG